MSLNERFIFFVTTILLNFALQSTTNPRLISESELSLFDLRRCRNRGKGIYISIASLQLKNLVLTQITVIKICVVFIYTAS